MTSPSPVTLRADGGAAVDPRWWREGFVEGRPMQEVLADRDVGAVFRFLRGMGWSLTSLCRATGLSESRVRAVLHGTQRITSYDVLERVALGLMIPRGAMGLAYTADTEQFAAPPAVAAVPAGVAAGSGLGRPPAQTH